MRQGRVWCGEPGEGKDMEFKREVAMLISNDNLPLVTVFGSGARVDFPIEYAWELHQQSLKFKMPGIIKTMAHSHPPGFTGISEEDRTTLKTWTIAFAPYPIAMDVVCITGRELSHRRFFYSMEPLDEWRKYKDKERKMDLNEVMVEFSD